MNDLYSSIYLCDVPILPTHQLDFKDINEQISYFNSKVKHTFSECSYQPRSGNIKVSGYVDDLGDCNYGFYTNTYNGTSKTFYFWIVQKELLARDTCLLTIQLDVWQTWLFDFKVEECFIERQHAVNDSIGFNLYPEEFELGDYVTSSRKAVEKLATEPDFFMGITDSEKGLIGGKFGLNYTGFKLKYYSHNDTSSMTSYIQELCNAGKADAIAFIFSYPHGLVEQYGFNSGQSGVEINDFTNVLYSNTLIQKMPEKFQFKGITYAPFNKKLLTYPYNFITVTNAQGSNVVLKYELFDNPKETTLVLESILAPNPTFSLTPKNYSGKEKSYEDSIETQGFGLCSWNNDNYCNWYANHQNSIVSQSVNARVSYDTSRQIANNNYNNNRQNINDNTERGIITTGTTAIGNLLGGNISGAIVGSINNGVNTYYDNRISNRNNNNDLRNGYLQNTTDFENTIRTILGQVQDAQVQPNTCKGDTTANGLDMGRKTATFFINAVQIRPEFARKIDMYFQMFGYACNEVGKPNIKGRDKWNYIKTVNAIVSGNIPAEDREVIQALLNNGLTIWHDEKFMFNYNQINKIISENVEV